MIWGDSGGGRKTMDTVTVLEAGGGGCHVETPDQLWLKQGLLP